MAYTFGSTLRNALVAFNHYVDTKGTCVKMLFHKVSKVIIMFTPKRRYFAVNQRQSLMPTVAASSQAGSQHCFSFSFFYC